MSTVHSRFRWCKLGDIPNEDTQRRHRVGTSRNFPHHLQDIDLTTVQGRSNTTARPMPTHDYHVRSAQVSEHLHVESLDLEETGIPRALSQVSNDAHEVDESQRIS